MIDYFNFPEPSFYAATTDSAASGLNVIKRFAGVGLNQHLHWQSFFLQNSQTLS